MSKLFIQSTIMMIMLIGFYMNLQSKLNWLNDEKNLKRLKKLEHYTERKEAEQEAKAA